MPVVVHFPVASSTLSASDAPGTRVEIPTNIEQGIRNSPEFVARVVNEGASYVYVRAGNSSVQAALPGAGPDAAIPPGQYFFLNIPAGITHIGAICRATQTAVLSISYGIGSE